MVVGAVWSVSGRSGQGLDRLPSVEKLIDPGPVSAQVQPALALSSGQASGQVQQPESQEFRGGLAQLTVGQGEVTEAGQQVGGQGHIWVHATLIAQCREGHRLSPRCLDLGDVVLDVERGAVPRVKPRGLRGQQQPARQLARGIPHVSLLDPAVWACWLAHYHSMGLVCK